MSKEKTAAVTEAELEKSAAELVDKAFAEVKTEEISKSGQGGDTNTEKMDGVKSDEDAKKERPSEAVGGKDVLKAKKAKKADDGEDDGKMDEEKEMETLKKEDMDKGCAKKSFEISAEDFEILAKAKAAQEELRKSEEEESFKKSVAAIVDEQLGGIREQLDGIVKALSKPVERKSVAKVEALEKSFERNEGAAEDLSKSDILDKMEELAKSNKISVNSVIEYEAGGTISNRHDLETVKKSLGLS